MRVFRIATIALLLLTIVPSFDGQSTPAAQHSPSSQQSALIEDLVYANRILYDQGSTASATLVCATRKTRNIS